MTEPEFGAVLTLEQLRDNRYPEKVIVQDGVDCFLPLKLDYLNYLEQLAIQTNSKIQIKFKSIIHNGPAHLFFSLAYDYRLLTVIAEAVDWGSRPETLLIARVQRLVERFLSAHLEFTLGCGLVEARRTVADSHWCHHSDKGQLSLRVHFPRIRFQSLCDLREFTSRFIPFVNRVDKYWRSSSEPCPLLPNGVCVFQNSMYHLGDPLPLPFAGDATRPKAWKRVDVTSDIKNFVPTFIHPEAVNPQTRISTSRTLKLVREFDGHEPELTTAHTTQLNSILKNLNVSSRYVEQNSHLIQRQWLDLLNKGLNKQQQSTAEDKVEQCVTIDKFLSSYSSPWDSMLPLSD